MAKRPTVTTISSGYASNTQLNGNFVALRDSFDNTLSLDGSTPNSMGADLDMNSNDVLNIGKLEVASLRVGGTLATPDNLTFNDASGIAYDQGGTSSVVSTVEAKLQETVSVKDFGAVGDGVTDDTAAFTAAIVYANLSGVSLYVPPAVYDFGGNNLSGGGLTPGLDIGSVHMWANQDATLQNIGTAHFSGEIILSGLNFVSCVQPVYMTGDIDKLTVSKCSFTDFTRAIYHNDNTSGVYVKNVLVEDNIFKNTAAVNDFMGCILLHRASTVTDALVQNNTMQDIVVSSAGTSTFGGFLAGNDTYPTTNYKRIRMVGNRITGCGNFHATMPSGASYGSYILAEDSEQSGNAVKGCGWINGLYMKGHGNTQAFNKVDAPQWGGITMKTAQDTTSKNNVQVGNVVTGVCDRKAAMRMFGRGQSVDNQVDITVTGELHPTEGGFGFRATYSSTHGPLKVTGTYICERGIQITGAGDVTIDANITSNGNGIELLNSVDLFGTVIISGRVECEGQAVYLNAAKRIDLRDFDFSSNLSGASGQAIFAYTTEAAVMSHVNGLITDTASDGLTLGYVVSLFSKTGGDLVNRFGGVDGVNIVTERNLTQVFGFFADAGVSGTGRLSFSDIDLDLQGNTCTSLLRLLTDPLYVSVDNVKVNGTLSRTIDGSGITVPDMIVSNGLMNYVATDNLASHTNATVTRSRIVNNKTA